MTATEGLGLAVLHSITPSQTHTRAPSHTPHSTQPHLTPCTLTHTTLHPTTPHCTHTHTHHTPPNHTSLHAHSHTPHSTQPHLTPCTLTLHSATHHYLLGVTRTHLHPVGTSPLPHAVLGGETCTSHQLSGGGGGLVTAEMNGSSRHSTYVGDTTQAHRHTAADK